MITPDKQSQLKSHYCVTYFVPASPGRTIVSFNKSHLGIKHNFGLKTLFVSS